jgi:hypothetical protein
MVRIVSTACLGGLASQFFQGDELDGIDFTELKREEQLTAQPVYTKPKKKPADQRKPIQFGKKIG